MARSSRPVNAPAAALAAALSLAGCSLFDSPREPRGHRVDPEVVQQLSPGVSTRADVAALLGTPTTTGTFDDENWFYISSVTHTRPAQRPAIEDQRIVVVRFDRSGVVRDIREMGPEAARPVQVVDRVTPTPGTERSFLQQLFGNIGRVGPSPTGQTGQP